MNLNELSVGQRVRWAAAFLAANQARDPRWHSWAQDAVGVVDRVLANGYVSVYWDGSHESCVHASDRLAFEVSP